MPEDPYQELLEKYPEAAKMRYPVGTFLQANEGDISKQEVASVLNRLHEYYDGRARAAFKNGSPDAGQLWRTRQETIERVADNLRVMLRVELAKGT